MILFGVQSQGISVFGMELVLKVKEIGLSDKDRRYQARNSCYQIWKSVCPAFCKLGKEVKFMAVATDPGPDL